MGRIFLMKRNKIAAGALALALGLGAVAPSFAADTKVSAEFTYDYKEAKNDFIEKWNALRAAEKNLETAKANEATAKAAYEAALKALNDFNAIYGKDGSYEVTLARYEQERARHLATYQKAGGTSTEAVLYGIKDEHADEIGNHVMPLPEGATIEEKTKREVQAQAVKDIVALNQRIREFKKDANWITSERANLEAKLARRQGDYNEAQNKRQAAEKAGDITLIFENVKPAKPVDKDEIKPETKAA